MIHSLGWLAVEACTSLFEIILIITFLNGFLSVKEMSTGKKVAFFIGAYILLFTGSTFLFDIPNALIINFFSITLLLSFALFRGKLANHFFSSVLLVAILSVIELIAMCILVLSLNINAASIQSEPFLRFICVILKNILSFAIIKVICHFRQSSFRDVGRVHLAFLLVVPIICVIITLLILNLVLTFEVKNVLMVLAAVLGLMYVNVIVFAVFEGLMRQMDKEYKYKMIERQLELQLNHYHKLAENRAVLSETLHDFKNHLNCIYNLYKYNKTEDLGLYIENLINVTDMEKVIDTGNPVIDALLNDKYLISQKTGIEFKKELNLPSNLKISPTDICAILGNSLDNAIEACKRIKNGAIRREIALSMTYKDSYLVIVIANTIDQLPLKEGKFFRSSKPSPELHGLGMHSIERTVKKYAGNMVVKCDQGFFKLEIVMPTA